MTVAAHRHYDGLARRGCSFKDGRYVRAVQVERGNRIVFRDTEGRQLYVNTDLSPDFAVQSISAETSSFGDHPHPVLFVFGFTQGAQDQECYVLSCDDYSVLPPVW